MLWNLLKGIHKGISLNAKHVLVFAIMLGPRSLLVKNPGAESLLGRLRFEGTNMTCVISTFEALQFDFLTRKNAA